MQASVTGAMAIISTYMNENAISFPIWDYCKFSPDLDANYNSRKFHVVWGFQTD